MMLTYTMFLVDVVVSGDPTIRHLTDISEMDSGVHSTSVADGDGMVGVSDKGDCADIEDAGATGRGDDGLTEFSLSLSSLDGVSCERARDWTSPETSESESTRLMMFSSVIGLYAES